MRKVIYSQNVHYPATSEARQHWKLEPIGEAVFHQFGVNFEEYENGPANFSTAIIELDDGTVLNLPVEQIKFIQNDSAISGFGFPAPNLDFLSIK